MDYYLDIRLRPDPEFPEAILMGALFNKLHRALVTLDISSIGVSFPEHTRRPRTLGGVLRVHGSAEALDQLMAFGWLTGMRDHVTLTDISAVPADARHRVVSRRQFKTSAERLRRRRVQRHNETLEQARAHIPDNVERKVTLPFVTIRSRSTGQAFSLFIEHGALRTEPTKGEFNRYGLSVSATVPWF